MRNLRVTAAVLALIFVLGLSVIPASSVRASTEGSVCTYLYEVHEPYAEHGIAAATDETNWSFYVYTPSYVALDDADEYWNFTVYVDCLDEAAAVPGATFKVYIYIYDGATNLTANSGSIRVDNESRVYGNISIAKASYEGLVQNGSADLYLKLVNGTGGSLKDYYTGSISVETYGVFGVIWLIIPMMMTMVVVMGMMGMLTNVFDGMGQSATRKRKSSKGSKGSRKKH